jgi:hypothetical protein
MKTFRLICVLLVSITAGAAIGYLLRRKSTGFVSTNPLHFVDTPSSNKVEEKAGQPIALSVPEQLERDLATSSGVAQWLYWMEVIEKATVNDLPRLASIAGNNQPAVRLVAARWMELNPRHFFDFLVRAGESGGFAPGQFENTLLSEWSKTNPEALIKALDEAPPFGTRDRWRTTVAGNVIGQNPELGLKLMAQWHIENFSPNMGGVAKWAARDPRHAAEFVLSTPLHTASREVMKTVGSEWAKTNPGAALEFSASKRGEFSSILAASALKTWAERDLKEATEWLASADRSTRNRLSPAVVEVWAEKDAAGALLWSEANLTGSSLNEAASGVLRGAAEKDVAAAARLVAVMQPSSARTAGAVAVAEKWLPDLDSESAPKAAAVQWLRALDPESIRKVLERYYGQWAQSEPRSFADFLKSTTVEHIASHIYESVARNYARQEPRKAIEWASSTPDYARAETGGQAFAEWRRAQPEEAMDWWNHLPAGDPRRKSFLESAVRSVAWDPSATDQFAALAALDPTAARGVLDKMSLSPERRSALMQAIARN